jgi:hypothetical protein
MSQPFQCICAITQTPWANTAEILRDDFEYGCDVQPHSGIVFRAKLFRRSKPSANLLRLAAFRGAIRCVNHPRDGGSRHFAPETSVKPA